MKNKFNMVIENFKDQAIFCQNMGSSFYADLLIVLSNLISRDNKVGDIFSTWKGDVYSDAVALRFVAALNYLVITEQELELTALFPPNKVEIKTSKIIEELKRVLNKHEDLITQYLKSPPQTNEVGRSGVLLGGFLEISKRFGPEMDIFEIGTSAGLNLAFNKFYYIADNWSWGNSSSTVQLNLNWEGCAPPQERITVCNKYACDISPINLNTEKNRLLSYIWPDQIDRVSRTCGAIDYAINEGVKIDALDAVEWVRQQHQAPKVRPRVFFHSIMRQYLTKQQRGDYQKAVDEIGKTATTKSPVIWMCMEPASHKRNAELKVMFWPDETEQELAECGYHGEWVRWW